MNLLIDEITNRIVFIHMGDPNSFFSAIYEKFGISIVNFSHEDYGLHIQDAGYFYYKIGVDIPDDGYWFR